MTTVRPTTATPARALWVPLAVIVVAAIAGWAAVWSVRGQLPDPVAHHWGPDGRPDQFGPLGTQLIFAVVISLALPLLLLLLGAGLRQLRALGPVAAGTAVFISAVAFGSLYAQRGQASAAAAEVTWPLWVGILGGIVAGLLVWLLVRDTSTHTATSRPSPDAPHLAVKPGTKVAWTGSTRSSGALWAAALLGLAPTLILGVILLSLGNASIALLLFLLTIILAGLLSNLHCRVSVDSRGVRALGFGLVTWVRVPLESIEEASVAEVSPMGDFGGWGYRAKLDGSGAWGLVTGAGEALVVTRAGKQALYLTVDGAAEAAAVLNTLAARRAS